MKLETIMGCGIDIYFDYQLVDARTGEILADCEFDKTDSKSGEEEQLDYCKYWPYKDRKVRKWEIKDRKMILYISQQVH